jgi:hypothetical protein
VSWYPTIYACWLRWDWVLYKFGCLVKFLKFLEKDVAKNQQLEILREEVAKGFEQLAAGESSKHSVMDIFEQASLSVDEKSIRKDSNA